MMIELQRFVHFKEGFFDSGKKREWLEFEPITINTEYIATLRRREIWGGFNFCEVWMVDHGNNFVVDKTYEEMRDLVMRGNGK